jgi:hypothetical protein
MRMVERSTVVNLCANVWCRKNIILLLLALYVTSGCKQGDHLLVAAASSRPVVAQEDVQEHGGEGGPEVPITTLCAPPLELIVAPVADSGKGAVAISLANTSQAVLALPKFDEDANLSLNWNDWAHVILTDSDGRRIRGNAAILDKLEQKALFRLVIRTHHLLYLEGGDSQLVNTISLDDLPAGKYSVFAEMLIPLVDMQSGRSVMDQASPFSGILLRSKKIEIEVQPEEPSS